MCCNLAAASRSLQEDTPILSPFFIWWCCWRSWIQMTFITTAPPVPLVFLLLQICFDLPQPSTTLDSLRKLSPGLYRKFSPLQFNETCSSSFIDQRWNGRFPITSRCFLLLYCSRRLRRDVIKMVSFLSTRHRLTKPETCIFSDNDTLVYLEKSHRRREEVSAGGNQA